MANSSGTTTAIQEGAAVRNKGEQRIADIRVKIGEMLNEIESLRHDASNDLELREELRRVSGILAAEFEEMRGELHSFERTLSFIRYSQET